MLPELEYDDYDTPGWLPDSEPCAYAGWYGQPEWHEHDHAECREAIEQAGGAR